MHPKYWLTWLSLGMLWLLSRLPFDMGLRAGRGLGLFLYQFFPKRRKVTTINLALAFPELSEQQLNDRAKAVYKHLGMSITETAWMWFRNTRILEDRISVSGEQHLEAALAADTGMILLQAHFSFIEASGNYTGMRWNNIAAVYDPPRNRLAADWLLAQRERRVSMMIDNKNIRKMIRQLRQGKAVWYSPDQSVSAARGGIPTRYFNQPALTTSGTARMVQMTNATVIPMLPTRHEDGKSYHIAFLKPVEFEHEDETSRTQTINDLFEEQIRHYPEQYLWSHKRFKPPAGEPNPYT